MVIQTVQKAHTANPRTLQQLTWMCLYERTPSPTPISLPCQRNRWTPSSPAKRSCLCHLKEAPRTSPRFRGSKRTGCSQPAVWTQFLQITSSVLFFPTQQQGWILSPCNNQCWGPPGCGCPSELQHTQGHTQHWTLTNPGSKVSLHSLT